MIWATVRSWSCFCWLYRASPFLAAKNIINLISVLTIWWCPCVESCVVGRGCLLWSVRSFGKPLPRFFLYSKSTFACYSRCYLTSYFCIPASIMKRTSFLVLVLKGLARLHRTVQLQLLQHYWSEHRLGLPWYWMVCLGNEQRSFYGFWDCIQVLHFGFFCWLWWLLHFF